MHCVGPYMVFDRGTLRCGPESGRRGLKKLVVTAMYRFLKSLEICAIQAGAADRICDAIQSVYSKTHNAQLRRNRNEVQ